MINEECILMIVTYCETWVTHTNIKDLPQSTLECCIVWLFRWIDLVLILPLILVIKRGPSLALILNLISSEHVESNGEGNHHQDNHKTEWVHDFHDIYEDLNIL